MHPELQSALLAETSAPLILLGGAVLLYRSFREQYLLPWIAGWGIYTLARLFLVISASDGQVWLALANLALLGAITLFAASIFRYVNRPRLALQIFPIVFVAALLGMSQALSAHAHVFLFFFRIGCWLISCTAAWQLIVFLQGRDNFGGWILGPAMLLLFPNHWPLAYTILADVLLGIGMMMIVLDDSRVQNQRLDMLNRLSQVAAGPDDFFPILDEMLAGMIEISGAGAAWFRLLEEGKLRLARSRGLSAGVADAIFEIDATDSIGGLLLDRGEVGVVQRRNMNTSLESALALDGIDHIVVVPVTGKSTRIGLLVLGMNCERRYTDGDKAFLKAAANQLGLAAENRRLVQQLVHSVHDLTETKAAEERYKTLFDHMQEGVFVSSPEGRLLDCNEAFVRMMGYSSKEELLHVDVSEILYVDAGDRLRFLTEMQKHGFIRNLEFTVKRKDGSHITVIESSFAMRGAEGKVRYQGVVLDITEKKKTENEMRRRNRELSALHTIAVSFNQSFDLDEALQSVLSQIVEVFGTDMAVLYLLEKEGRRLRMRASYGLRNPLSSQLQELAGPVELLDLIRAEHTELIKNEVIMESPLFVPIIHSEAVKASLGIMLWRKDEILGALATSSRSEREFGAQDENIMVALGRQLATTIDRIKLYEETRKAYDDLRRTQEQLLQSEKMSAVGRMISGVAHELNNPLTAISGYVQLLESEKADARVQDFVRKLHKQTDRAQRIVQNLLSFSRQYKPQRIYVDLRHVMEDTIALRDFELRTHGIVLQRDFGVRLPAVVADPHQLEQVFLNIINNAVDAILETGSGGVLTIRIFAEEPEVVCEFHDSGPGMSDPKHVFDPFYTTKGVGKGTGLGLSICYGIVKEHGGEITAYNHAQGGAVVQVRLPEAVGEKPASEGERIVARRESSMHGRVLLLDSAAVVDYEREVLSASGLDVLAVSSGKKVLDLLERDNFDLVLLDSELLGHESRGSVLDWIRQEKPEMASRVVLMVLPSDGASSRSFINGDGILCFVKPFEATALLAVLRRVLRASSAQAGAIGD